VTLKCNVDQANNAMQLSSHEKRDGVFFMLTGSLQVVFELTDSLMGIEAITSLPSPMFGSMTWHFIKGRSRMETSTRERNITWTWWGRVEKGQ